MAGEVHISPFEINEAGHRVEAEIRMRERVHRVYYRTTDSHLSGELEAFLAIALLPAMKMKLPILASGMVSPRFLAGYEKIQDQIKSWKPRYGRVKILEVIPQAKGALDEGRVGVFFSGGLDSFHTFLRHQDEITDLIFIQGFDISLAKRALLNKVSEMVHAVAAHFGKRAIIIETNSRKFLDQYVFWGFTHGSVLASVGHLLSQQFKRIYIASSHNENRLRPWGSHPNLDLNWGTEGLEFVHDGCEADRMEKMVLVSQWDIALKSLCVCLEHRGGAYNCGRCEKCRRVMIYLRSLGLLDQCTTFDKPFDIREVFRLDITKWHSLQRSLAIVESRGTDPELAEALRKVVNRPAWQKKMKGAAHNLRNKISKRKR